MNPHFPLPHLLLVWHYVLLSPHLHQSSATPPPSVPLRALIVLIFCHDNSSPTLTPPFIHSTRPFLLSNRSGNMYAYRPHSVCTVQTFRNAQTGPMLYLFVSYYHRCKRINLYAFTLSHKLSIRHCVYNVL